MHCHPRPFPKFPLLAFALSAALGACSTTKSVTVVATAGADMNPSRQGTSAVLEVYAFFLRDTEAFDGADKQVGDFLTPQVRSDLGPPPAFLEKSHVDIERITVRPDAGTVETKLEVPKEAMHIGLVAKFVGESDKWRLKMPLDGGPIRFQVVGRQLLAAEPPKKEAASAKTTDG